MKPKVAIIDDSQMMRNFLGVFLKQKYEVLAFENAKDAIFRLLRAPKIDLILLDLNMPDMNGIEFLDIARSVDRLKHVPIVMLSGAEKSEDRINCLEHGATDFITKPFNPRELDVKIASFFKLEEEKNSQQ